MYQIINAINQFWKMFEKLLFIHRDFRAIHSQPYKQDNERTPLKVKNVNNCRHLYLPHPPLIFTFIISIELLKRQQKKRKNINYTTKMIYRSGNVHTILTYKINSFSISKKINLHYNTILQVLCGVQKIFNKTIIKKNYYE